MDCKTVRLPLSAIDTANHFFRITTETETETLTASISATGLLHPPFLKSKEAGFIVISGFRRLAALKKLGKTEVHAVVLDEGLSGRELAEIAITENSLQRSLNPLETARSMALLHHFVDDRTELRERFKRLGLPDSPAVIETLLPIVSLQESIQNLVLTGVINPKIAGRLGELDAATAEGYVRIFRMLKPGLNRQREIITLFTEIAAREKMSVPMIFKEPEFSLEQLPQPFDRNQVLKTLMYRLKKRRFPNLVKKEEEYRNEMKKIRLPENMKLIPPPFFENEIHTLEIRLQSLSEVLEFLKKTR